MYGLSGGMQILELDQEKVATQTDPEYRVQPGIIVLGHLELVALERAAKSPHTFNRDQEESSTCDDVPELFPVPFHKHTQMQ